MKRLWASFGLVLGLALPGCAPQTSSDGKQTIRNKNSEPVGENGGDVAIDDGSKITVPAGAVAVGTQVTVQKVADDPAFEIGAASASSTVEMMAVSADGTPLEVAAQPMTIQLSIESGTALQLSGYELTNSFDDMCILLKTISGKQMIWRRTLLTIDAEAKRVSIQSLYFGKYKAVYCGTTAVAGFDDAAETGATGAPPVKISMTVPKDFAPDVAHGKYCFALVRSSDKNCDDASDDSCTQEPSPALATSEKARTSGADHTLTLNANAALFQDGYHYFVAVSLMAADQACGLVVGKDVDETGPGNVKALYAFKVDTELLKSGLGGVLGAGDPYKLESVTVKIGGEGAFANLAAHDESRVCIDVDGAGGKTLRQVQFAAGKIDGQATLSMLAASPSGEALDQIHVRVGDSCSNFDTPFGSVTLATGKPYEAAKPVNVGDTLLLTPIKLRLTRTNTVPSISMGCLRIFEPNSNSGQKPLGQIMLGFDQANFNIYVPYLSTPAGTVPKYDFEITALKQGDCRTSSVTENQALPPVRQNAKELNATIDVQLPF